MFRRVTRKKLLLSLGALALMTVPAHAAMCGPQKAVATILVEKYKEYPVAVGVVTGHGVMQVYANEDTATWSVTVVTPQLQMCIIAAGQGWQTVEPPPKGEPL